LVRFGDGSISVQVRGADHSATGCHLGMLRFMLNRGYASIGHFDFVQTDAKDKRPESMADIPGRCPIDYVSARNDLSFKKLKQGAQRLR